MDSLEAANRLLEAQRAALGETSERAREAELWRDATPAECLATMFALCREADHYLAQLTPGQLERALAPAPLPADTVLLLAAQRAHAA
ncbi:MAG: hypothetical protein IPL61_26550 [Myxococcales bacterium]|nr:hypothetical protein [Myxococcales bacterium]